MIWATVSSWSCFCWLYRASPSLATKNMINLISVSTIWWCPCVESSLVLLEEGVCYVWPVCSLGKTLLAFALLHSVLQGQIFLLVQVFLDFLILHSSLLKWKWHLFWVLVLKGLIGLHKSIQLQLLQCYWLGHRLWLLWYWMVCLGNEQIILSFLRLHPSMAFWALLLTIRAAPFFLRDFAHKSRYNGHLS